MLVESYYIKENINWF